MKDRISFNRKEVKELPNGKIIIFPKAYYRNFPMFIVVAKEDYDKGEIPNRFDVCISKKTGKEFLLCTPNGNYFFDNEGWGCNRDYYPASYSNNPDCKMEVIGYSNGGGAGQRLSLLKVGADLLLDNEALKLIEEIG